MLPTDIQRLRKSSSDTLALSQVQHQIVLKMFSPENCNNLDGYVVEMGRIGLGLGNRYENFVTWRGSGVLLPVKSSCAPKLQSFQSNKLIKIFEIISIYLVIDYFPLR